MPSGAVHAGLGLLRHHCACGTRRTQRLRLRGGVELRLPLPLSGCLCLCLCLCCHLGHFRHIILCLHLCLVTHCASSTRAQRAAAARGKRARRDRLCDGLLRRRAPARTSRSARATHRNRGAASQAAPCPPALRQRPRLRRMLGRKAIRAHSNAGRVRARDAARRARAQCADGANGRKRLRGARTCGRVPRARRVRLRRSAPDLTGDTPAALRPSGSGGNGPAGAHARFFFFFLFFCWWIVAPRDE
jgi:hypothetical protein